MIAFGKLIPPIGTLRRELLFGVNSSPEIFKRILEGTVAPCPNTMNYIDDIIVFRNSEEKHGALVRKNFHDNNVCLNEEKCIWKTQKLKFLGHVLSDRGKKVDPEKVQLITSFKDPKNKVVRSLANHLYRKIYTRFSTSY